MDPYGDFADTDPSLLDQIGDGPSDYFGISNDTTSVAPSPYVTEAPNFFDIINGATKTLGVIAGQASSLHDTYNKFTGKPVATQVIAKPTEKHITASNLFSPGSGMASPILPYLLGALGLLFFLRK